MSAQMAIHFVGDLERVSSRIGEAIKAFVRSRSGELFYAQELRDFVTQEVGITAPASADRILRDLRQRGLIQYEVVSRRESLYRAGERIQCLAK